MRSRKGSVKTYNGGRKTTHGAGQPPQEVMLRVRAEWPWWGGVSQAEAGGQREVDLGKFQDQEASICLSDTVMKREKELTISHKLLPYLPTPTCCSQVPHSHSLPPSFPNVFIVFVVCFLFFFQEYIHRYPKL